MFPVGSKVAIGTRELTENYWEAKFGGLIYQVVRIASDEDIWVTNGLIDNWVMPGCQVVSMPMNAAVEVPLDEEFYQPDDAVIGVLNGEPVIGVIKGRVNERIDLGTSFYMIEANGGNYFGNTLGLKRYIPEHCHLCGKELPQGSAWEYLWSERCNHLTVVGGVCPDCIAAKRVQQCQRCGHYTDTSLTAVNHEQMWVCDRCANSYYTECCFCGELVDSENAVMDAIEDMICPQCAEAFDHCFICGRPVPPHLATRCGDRVYCPSCANRGGRVNAYSYKPTPVFHGDARYYMGVELEIDDGSPREAAAVALGNLSDVGNLFYLKWDGSLGSTGIEIVTHPCSLDYHLNQFPWAQIASTALDYGYRSHDTTTCGLHVHVSREAFASEGPTKDREANIDLNIAKVLLLVDRFWDEFVRFSRRKSGALEDYARKPDAEITETDGVADCYIKGKDYKAVGDRYRAVNLCNADTVEFRIFRGTLKVDTIKATLQLLDNLIQVVTTTPVETIQKLSFQDILNVRHWDELDAYASARGLN